MNCSGFWAMTCMNVVVVQKGCYMSLTGLLMSKSRHSCDFLQCKDSQCLCWVYSPVLTGGAIVRWSNVHESPPLELKSMSHLNILQKTECMVIKECIMYFCSVRKSSGWCLGVASTIVILWDWSFWSASKGCCVRTVSIYQGCICLVKWVGIFYPGCVAVSMEVVFWV